MVEDVVAGIGGRAPSAQRVERLDDQLVLAVPVVALVDPEFGSRGAVAGRRVLQDVGGQLADHEGDVVDVADRQAERGQEAGDVGAGDPGDGGVRGEGRAAQPPFSSLQGIPHIAAAFVMTPTLTAQGSLAEPVVIQTFATCALMVRDSLCVNHSSKLRTFLASRGGGPQGSSTHE
ncbi:hypothetical protein [Actinomadura madurae]|uniref:hypothetical protein n=1 Tax=Actinomadura madurae TaxID=1993 RepID=UPI0020D20069|nr:hypothetical protein [Actinomadura madurae]MCP9968582.1 hypothetical protein [Actinomadura madurae]MCP9981055.1 hypothetical protein [Actinomadura madurae]